MKPGTENLVHFSKGFDPRRNITGANKGRKQWRTRLEELGIEIIQEKDKKGNIVPAVSYRDAIIKKAIELARDGNVELIKFLWEKHDGTTEQIPQFNVGIQMNLADEAQDITPDMLEDARALGIIKDDQRTAIPSMPAQS